MMTTETKRLTTGEAAALEKVLARGGWVVVHSGRETKESVQKQLLKRMLRAGLVRCVRGHIDRGHQGVNVEVTAAGCGAIAEYRKLGY